MTPNTLKLIPEPFPILQIQLILSNLRFQSHELRAGVNAQQIVSHDLEFRPPYVKEPSPM